MKFFGNRERDAQAHDLVAPTTEAESKSFGVPPAEKEPRPHLTDEDGVSIEAPSEDLQQGVKKAEAVTLTWTRSELIVAYAL